MKEILEVENVIQQIDWTSIVFMTFLAAAAWQDLRKKSVSLWLYLGYGAAACAVWIVGRDFKITDLNGLPVGLVLLAAGRASGGAIGSGDGWFFVVSGLYLSLSQNVRLLLGGLLFCGLYCLFLILYAKVKGKNMRGRTVPFLPFLVPAWIWMVII